MNKIHKNDFQSGCVGDVMDNGKEVYTWGYIFSLDNMKIPVFAYDPHKDA